MSKTVEKFLDVSDKQVKLMAAGGFAGTVAKTCVAPLERIRIMAQTGNTQQTHLRTLQLIIKLEGITGLWRGNFVTCLRAFPSRGILFSTNDFYKSLLLTYFYSSTQESTTQQQQNYRKNKTTPKMVSFFSGSFAGMTAAVITYPLDIVRTRISSKFMIRTKHANNTALAGSNNLTLKYSDNTISKSFVRSFLNILRYEGVRGMYKGIWPTLFGAIPYEGVKFLSYDIYRTQLINIFYPKQEGPKKSNVLIKLTSGALAGMSAGLALYPNDTVRRYLQMQNIGKRTDSTNKKVTVVTAIRRLYNEDGVRRFYRGLLPYSLRVVPNSAIQFAVYETMKSFII